MRFQAFSFALKLQARLPQRSQVLSAVSAMTSAVASQVLSAADVMELQLCRLKTSGVVSLKA